MFYVNLQTTRTCHTSGFLYFLENMYRATTLTKLFFRVRRATKSRSKGCSTSTCTYVYNKVIFGLGTISSPETPIWSRLVKWLLRYGGWKVRAGGTPNWGNFCQIQWLITAKPWSDSAVSPKTNILKQNLRGWSAITWWFGTQNDSKSDCPDYRTGSYNLSSWLLRNKITIK